MSIKSAHLYECANFLVGGWLGDANCQVDHRDVRSGDAEGHAGQFAVESRDHLAHGLKMKRSEKK